MEQVTVTVGENSVDVDPAYVGLAAAILHHDIFIVDIQKISPDSDSFQIVFVGEPDMLSFVEHIAADGPLHHKLSETGLQGYFNITDPECPEYFMDLPDTELVELTKLFDFTCDHEQDPPKDESKDLN